MSKRKHFIYLLALCAIAAIIFGCAAIKADSDANMPKLIIGNGNFRPYSYLDVDGNPSGIDVDMAREACRRMGYEPVFVQVNWEKREAALDSGEIDCLWSCLSMDEYKDDYRVIGPYMDSRQVVAVLSDSDINTLADLEGREVAIQAGSTLENTFLERTDARIPQVKFLYTLVYMDEIAIALRNEYVDACVSHDAVLRDYLSNTDIEYRFLSEELERTHLGIAFSKSADEQLCKRLEAALGDMQRDGTIAKILRTYGIDPNMASGEDK